ncbi:MAG TPA: hypothetical protein VE398_14180 [Acidobacteriota bacterium]|nr:hypothetical protein [Acidobacteriota bacterium]
MSRFSRIRRIRPAESYVANFAAPEDIIIMKMHYRDGGSEKHLRDITGILKVSRDEVNLAYIAEWSRRLELTEIWEMILERIGQVGSNPGR